MRLPRLRLTIRSVMVIVAVAALALAAEATRRRMANLSSAYRLRALVHGNKAVLARSERHRERIRLQARSAARSEVRQMERRIPTVVRVSLRNDEEYERAVSRPWLPIDPDPTPPQP